MMSAWYKTLRRGSEDNPFTDHKDFSENHHVGTIHKNSITMGYDDVVRAARTFNVESSPLFLTCVRGKLLMTDYSEKIKIYSPNGKHLQTVHADYKDSILSGIAANPSENSLFVCDARANTRARVQIFNIHDDINPVVFIGQGLFRAPHGITVTESNKTLVTDVERKEVFIIHDNGYDAEVFGGSGVRPGQFQFPHDVVYDTQHKRIIVSDTHNHRLQVFDESGLFIQLVEFNKTTGKRLFNFPTGMSFDHTGNLVVCESGKNTLQVLSQDLRPHKKVALGTMGLQKPSAVTVLHYDRLCISSAAQSSLLIF